MMDNLNGVSLCKVIVNGEMDHTTLAIMYMVIRKEKEHTNIHQARYIKVTGKQEAWMGKENSSKMEIKH